MKPEIAQKISELMLDVSARLDGSIPIVRDHASPEEFAAYRQAVGGVMGQIYCDILSPLYQQHPSLTPSPLKGP